MAFCATLPTQREGHAAPTPAAIRMPAAPSGFAENDSDPRAVLLRDILPDLRVHVDLDPKDMPRNRLDGDLAPQEVQEAVALGIGNWASILPQMRFRLVDAADSANLVLRFRAYGAHISGGASAEAFTPGRWRPPQPAPGSFDFSCGARVRGRTSAGKPCREVDNNIILFQTRTLAFKRIHFLDARMHWEYLAAMTDRADASKRFFRFLPDAGFRVWPPDRTTCVTGASRSGSVPVWDPVCLTDADWATLPHGDKFGREIGSFDIAELVQHEFGHALLGMHTGDGGRCTETTGSGYQDYTRDPVYLADSTLRRARRTGPGASAAIPSYSVLFPGNGLDAAWNSRGVFPLDAERLASGALDWECRPAGSWRGYAVSYPRSSAWIVLQNREGGTKFLDDWEYALRLLGWPSLSEKPGRAEWFQTGILPK